MEVKIQKWGNSHGVRIPIDILNALNIKENDKMLIEEMNDSIVLSKPKHKTIVDRIAEYNEEYKCSEFNPSDVKGNEIW